mmetsp:Transcript_24293/g.43791  ORF Transcript_24293/g.43791 Transcript_24293/m.43791 type:complete len:289 (-) Transcript_24293:1144-2010(-)|eukprot:CAMPEP_0201630464 /NCGR_PEP_ID=MMETSP0493-20130528/4770_1 /ASSEMBLY_ACC=CAM_ASM_000838 /TAXON_ID=420259 /ORGANISM="Thalassiosira gravida, Strain GMp14c1" /LENGTH=288 /DNA_ID=CAMNT_0048101629 /DNA_START=6 /DNA_END=872 /DNA_ORIENTATION=-
MSSSEQDSSDDISWCIGDEKEGFCASQSIYESDISVTDGEGDNDSTWTDKSESLEDALNQVDSMPNMPDEVLFHPGRASQELRPVSEPRNSEIHDDGECATNCSDDSVDTALTETCSELEDSFQDADSFHRKKDEPMLCPQESIRQHSRSQIYDDDDAFDIPVLTDACGKLCVDEIMAKASSMMVGDDYFEDCNDHFVSAGYHVRLSTDEMVGKASSMMASSDTEFEDYSFILRETLEKVLNNAIELAASLTLVAHLCAKKDREAKLFKRRHRTTYTYEVMPTLDFEE